jgi:hypothetical protein
MDQRLATDKLATDETRHQHLAIAWKGEILLFLRKEAAGLVATLQVGAVD